ESVVFPILKYFAICIIVRYYLLGSPNQVQSKESSILKPLKKYLSSKRRAFRPLGVVSHREKVYLYYSNKENSEHTFNLARSKDGFSFSAYRKDLVITNFKQYEDISKCTDFYFTKMKKYYMLRYKKKSDKRFIFATATTSDFQKFEYNYYSPLEQDEFVIIPDKTFNKYHIAYCGEYDISVCRSKDLKRWEVTTPSVLMPRPAFFDKGPLEIETVLQTEKGILLLYHSKIETKKGSTYVVGAALFDKKDPSKLLWRSNEPIWEQAQEWEGYEATPIGVVNHKGSLISY